MEIISELIIIEDDGTENTQRDEGYGARLDKRRDSLISCLLKNAKLLQGCLQLQAIKAVSNLARDAHGAKSVVKQGEIALFSDLITKLRNKLMVEEIARRLYNLSMIDEYKASFIRDGCIKALVKSLRKWANNADVLEQIVATCEKCCAEIAAAVLAIATLCGRGNHKSDLAGIGRITGIFQAFLQLTGSTNKDIRSLLQTRAEMTFQKFRRGSLVFWLGCQSQDIAISQGGGIAPPVPFTLSHTTEVHDNAPKALCNLALEPCNAPRIIYEGGVSALIHVCNSSSSKMGCFCSALALACLLDARVDKDLEMGTSSGGSFRAKEMVLNEIGKYVSSVCDKESELHVAASSSFSSTSLLELGESESMYIRDTYHLHELEIRWLLDMIHNSYPEIKACAAFALLQPTSASNNYSVQHLNFMQKSGGMRILSVAAAPKSYAVMTKVLSKILLRYLEQNIAADLQCISRLQIQEN